MRASETGKCVSSGETANFYDRICAKANICWVRMQQANRRQIDVTLRIEPANRTDSIRIRRSCALFAFR
jgi:hypothetical protein